MVGVVVAGGGTVVAVALVIARSSQSLSTDRPQTWRTNGRRTWEFVPLLVVL